MIEEYSGSRSLMDLVKFLEDKMKEKTVSACSYIEWHFWCVCLACLTPKIFTFTSLRG